MQRNHIHSRAYGQARTAAKNAGFDEETCKAKGREAGKKAVREWLNGVDIDQNALKSGSIYDDNYSSVLA